MFIATLTLFHPRCYRMCPVCRKPSAFVTPVSILPLDFSDPGILQECQKLSWIAFAVINLQNSRYSLYQSGIKVKPITTWSPVFPAL